MPFTMSDYIAITALLFSVIAFVYSINTNRKKERIESPKNWLLEVSVVKKSNSKNMERLNHYYISADKNVEKFIVSNQDNLDKEMRTTAYNCSLEKKSSLNYFADAKENYYNVCIKNNSENTIYINRFERENIFLLLEQFIESKKCMLIAIAEYGGPDRLLINYNGTNLPYDISKDALFTCKTNPNYFPTGK